MKLGTDFPENWKEKSIKEEIPLSDILYGYVIENLMKRIEKSSFKEYLWITNENALGEEAYKKVTKESLEFIYIENKKKNFSDKTVAGMPLDSKVMELLKKELFLNVEENDIHWDCNIGEIGTGVYLLLNCTYQDMHVPVNIRIDAVQLSTQRPKIRKLNFMFEKKNCEYYAFSKESILSEKLFEIMRKLELISDMESYDMVSEIIKCQPVSGRHIIEDFKAMGKKEPKVISMKRLKQISSYKEYGYMKKKWQQYVRNRKEEGDTWEEVMERIEKFLTPLWRALCEDDIFVGDWMPELERFLE